MVAVVIISNNSRILLVEMTQLQVVDLALLVAVAAVPVVVVAQTEAAGSVVVAAPLLARLVALTPGLPHQAQHMLEFAAQRQREKSRLL